MLPASLSTTPYFPSILRLFALLSLSCFCFYLGTRWATPYEDALFLPAQPSPSGYASLVLHRHPRDQDPGADDLDVHQALVDFRHAGASSPRSRSPGNDGSPHRFGVLRDDGSINHEFTGDEVTGDENLDIDWEDRDNNTIAYVSTKMSSSFKSYKFGVCPPTMKEYIPCLDNVAAIKQLKSTSKGEKFERHCPMEKGARFCCLIAPPPGYKYPIRWPQSRDKVWYNNVPHVRLVEDKGGQNWIAIKNDKFVFPGGGTQFAHGANQYLDQMAKMVSDIAFGVHTRVALDIGCGVASWGAYLMSRDVLPLSIAPKDVHENQIQFALERGVPAMVAALATRRLLYPSQAFDLIHCSRCRIEWNRDGGILLLEVDRILRSGGFFAWAAQPVYKHEGGLPEAWHDMEDLATRMCWKLVAKEGYIAIWQKPFDNTCYYNRTVGTQPPLCEASDDPDAVWYVPLKACITLLPESSMGSKVPDWPARLYSPPSRLQGVNTDANTAKKEVFIAEQRYWNEIVGGYLRGLGLKKEEVRNVMDMNAGYGGFAAALIDLKVDWWVLNVVPTTSIKTLPVIYDRGLIGVAHDWCESFDTYPRTYDLLHAVRLFTLEENRCNIARIVLEMDRILRPGGWVLVRDSSEMVLKIESIARSVKWKTRILGTESGPFGKDKLLSCQKELWHA